jgi:hypothetical protein
LEKRHASIIVALIQPSIEIDEDVVFPTIKTFDGLAVNAGAIASLFAAPLYS